MIIKMSTLTCLMTFRASKRRLLPLAKTIDPGILERNFDLVKNGRSALSYRLPGKERKSLQCVWNPLRNALVSLFGRPEHNLLK
jgi:hypothetical protein